MSLLIRFNSIISFSTSLFFRLLLVMRVNAYVTIDPKEKLRNTLMTVP